MSHNQNVEINEEEYSKLALLYNYLVTDEGLDSTFSCTPATFRKLVEDVPNINYVFRATDCLKKLDKNVFIYKLPNVHYVFLSQTTNCPKPLDKGFLVGNTLLHVLQKIKIDSIAYFNVLLDLGADFTIKNGKGNTVVHEVIEEDLKKLFITRSDDKDRLQHASSVLSAHISRAISTNPCNKNGLTHFHIACMLNHVPAVEFFLKHGTSVNEAVNNDSPMLPGFTALHFAANYCALDVVKVLLEHNIDINAKDAQDSSPLYILIQEKLEINKKLMTKKSEKTTSDLEIYKKIDQMIILITNNAAADLIESLHALCSVQDLSIIEEFLYSKGTNQLNSQVNSDMLIWPGYSALHFAAHFSVDMVRLLVKKGAQLELKDAKGVTPFDICLQRFKPREIVSILECHPTWLSLKTNLSSLIRKTNFLNKSSNINIHIGSSICAGFTPLHLAVTLTGRPKDYWNTSDHYFIPLRDYESKKSKSYLEKVKSCLKYNADVTAKNASNSTPLHLAFQLQESHTVFLLLENHKKIVNPIDANNLSHLHIACAAKDKALVKKLLAVEPDINRAVTSEYVWYDVKFKKSMSSKLYHSFVIAKGSTALHFAAIVRCPEIVQLLIENGADVLIKDCKGFDPLERILKCTTYSSYEREELDVIKLLLRQKSRVTIQTTDGLNRILRCYSSLSQNTSKHIFSSDNTVQNRIFQSIGITPLHLACKRQDLDRVRQLLENGADASAQVSMDSPLWPGNTPLHVSIDNINLWMAEVNDEAIRLLLNHGADVTLTCANRQTPLHMVSSNYLKLSDTEPTSRLVHLLLSHHKDFAVNPVSADGLSHFHIACFANNIEAVKKFIEHGVDVNQATDFFFPKFGGYSSLHFAAHFICNEVVNCLLAHGADVHRKVVGQDNVLHSVVPNDRNSGRDIIANLIRVGVDVHATNALGETPLEKLLMVREVRQEEVDLYLKANCRVNYYNPIKQERLLALALERDSEGITIFDEVIKAADVTDINEDGRNAIHNVVSLKPPIFWNFEELHEVYDNIVPVDKYISSIEKLTFLGLDIDQQDQKGLTPLHVAAQMQNANGITSLLYNGADINLIDREHKTAYAYILDFVAHTKYRNLIQEDYNLNILGSFVEHIAILNFLNLEVSKLNRDINIEAREYVELSSTNRWLELCRDELEKSKNQKICSSAVTLYDFLSETGAVSAYPNMCEPTRQIISKYFKDHFDVLQRKYRLLAGIIILQFRKALARVDLIEPATDSLKCLAQLDFPLLCTEMILKFLTNKDLENTIVAAAE